MIKQELSKEEIVKKIKNISYNNAVKDHLQLTKLDTNKIKNETRIGNKFVDYFTFAYRLETISKKGITYWDFVSSIENQKEKKYIKRLFDYQTKKGIEYYTGLYSIFKLHCGSIGLFKPCRALELLYRFNPTNILDPFAGWGCRLTASCVYDAESYIGIDSNISLVTPLSEMAKYLKLNGSSTKITLMFKDCLDVSYNELTYDCVLTSPPYYNYEVYAYMDKLSTYEWHQLYIKIFSKTFKHLLVGGCFIINILNKVYEEVLKPLLGDADYIIPFKKKKNKSNDTPNEAVFVWIKKSGCFA